MKLAAIILLLASSCDGASNPCSTEPAGSINAFFPGDTPSRDTTLVVERVTPASEGFRYDFRDGSHLMWIAAEPLPVAVGKSYRFVVQYRPGMPDATGILVFDGDVLVFAALTDQILRFPIPQFEMAIGEPVCDSRGSTKCHESLVNVPLTIAHAGHTVTVHHGETARLGDYEIKALTVQRVRYASRCADAGLPAISFTVRRAR